MTKPASQRPPTGAGAPATLPAGGPGSPDVSSDQSLPHDRDEKPGMTDGKPSKRIEQGRRDVENGVKDTSRGPEADRAYQRQK